MPSGKAPDKEDAVEYANWAVAKLKAMEPAVKVGGEQVQFESSTPQVAHLIAG